jgi:hypothetical protein
MSYSEELATRIKEQVGDGPLPMRPEGFGTTDFMDEIAILLGEKVPELPGVVTETVEAAIDTTPPKPLVLDITLEEAAFSNAYETTRKQAGKVLLGLRYVVTIANFKSHELFADEQGVTERARRAGMWAFLTEQGLREHKGTSPNPVVIGSEYTDDLTEEKEKFRSSVKLVGFGEVEYFGEKNDYLVVELETVRKATEAEIQGEAPDRQIQIFLARRNVTKANLADQGIGFATTDALLKYKTEAPTV